MTELFCVPNGPQPALAAAQHATSGSGAAGISYEQPAVQLYKPTFVPCCAGMHASFDTQADQVRACAFAGQYGCYTCRQSGFDYYLASMATKR